MKIDTAPLIEMLSQVNELRTKLRALILEQAPMRAKEYPIFEIGSVDYENDENNQKEVAYDGSFLVKPGNVAIVRFGEEVIIYPGLPGIPETMRMGKGIGTLGFWFDSLVIDDQDVDAYEVVGLFAGGKNMFPFAYAPQVGPAIPAKRFAASSPRILFPSTFVNGQLVVTLQVKNISTSPRPFRAKIVGREKVELVKIEKDEEFKVQA